MTATIRSLRAIQHWLLGVITTHPESAAAGTRAQQVASNELEGIVRDNAIASALDRLEIHRKSYFSRLEECLADDYPAVKFALGDERFAALCRSYVVAHPSHSPNLNRFGSVLPAFAREHAASFGAFVADLALLEWAIVEVLHARAPEGFSVSDLARIPNERLADLCFQASPTARMLSFDYPVNAYLQTLLDGEKPELPPRGNCSVVVVRSGYRIHRRELAQCQAVVLRHLLSGEPLGAALASVDASEKDVQLWFSEWTAWGVFESACVRGVNGGPGPRSSNGNGENGFHAPIPTSSSSLVLPLTPYHCTGSRLRMESP